MHNGNDNSGERGVEHQRVTVVTVAYNHETCLVSLGMKDVPIGLVQMMLDEAVRQLDIMRRQAAALGLKQQLDDQARASAIAASIATKR